eukprot:TRINITY_DN981_c0_g1_i3.p1 TRINITY_DN981_c0_g1~~TRINITY_DN981_c0_g1_i3.p1  ORF type:complete len:291 (+),score=48.52 TRINITY_DN981_c0_g1_i3:95-967(+)
MSWKVEDKKEEISGGKLTVPNHDRFKVSTTYNALYKPSSGGFSSGRHYFEVEIHSGDVKVGVTTETHFAPGWANRGLYYLGNLSDGNALLISSFGPKIKPSDKVGVALELTDSSLKIYVIINGKSLGLTFFVSAPYPKPLFPAVSFSSPGEVTLSMPSKWPSIEYEPDVEVGIGGSWEARGIKGVGEHAIGLNIKPAESNNYSLVFKVVNSITATLEHTSSGWSLKTGASTRVGTSGVAAAAESFILNMKLKDVVVQPEALELKTDGSSIRFKRTSDKKRPCTVNPFQKK